VSARLHVRSLFGRCATRFRDDLVVLPLRGHHKGCAATTRCSVDVCTKFIDEAAHDMLMPLLSCSVQCRTAITRNLVHVGTTFEQAAHHMLMTLLGSNVKSAEAIN
jgi:hypothetical protein